MISKDIETLIDHINYLLIGKENYSLEVTENVQYNKNKFELQFECKLIPKDEVVTFYNILDDLEESLDEHVDEDVYYDELNMILEVYDRLEGKEHYIVLVKDLGGGQS